MLGSYSVANTSSVHPGVAFGRRHSSSNSACSSWCSARGLVARRRASSSWRSPADVSELSGPLPCVSATESSDVSSMSITADSSRVVYLADQETIGVSELFSVPIGGPPSAGVKLNGELAPGAEVRALGGYRISPDGSWVVYRAGPYAEEKLHSVPVSGPANSGAELSDDLPPVGYDSDFAVVPGSQSVVSLARQDAADGVELCSVPISGYTAADVLVLNGTLVEGGDVMDFQLASDGSFAIYRADEDADEVLGES